jgi:hypothetical protein
MIYYEIEVRAGAGWLLKPERYASLPPAVAKAATIRSAGSVARIVQVTRTEVRQGSRSGWPGQALRA